jgi:hypothetical protein
MHAFPASLSDRERFQEGVRIGPKTDDFPLDHPLSEFDFQFPIPVFQSFTSGWLSKILSFSDRRFISGTNANHKSSSLIFVI